MLPDFFKIFLAAVLFLCLIYPVYKFIFIISARRYSLEIYSIKKKILKENQYFIP